MTYTLPKIKQDSKPAHYRQAVTLCVDNNYLPYAMFVAQQIIEKEEQIDFDIVICVPSLKIVPAFASQHIRFCEVDFSIISALPVGRLSSATYHKIFLPEIFKDNYDCILYLDADVYINKSCISEILSENDDSKGLKMVVDISEIERKSGFNFHNAYLNRYITLAHQYRNAGVILFNCKRLIEIDYLEEMLSYALKNRHKLIRHDQTLINTVLHKEIGPLSFLYNYQLINTTIPLVDEFQPKILHFVGELKPWNTESRYVGSFFSEYQYFILNNFPRHQLLSKTEFQLKLESRKRKHKYKNVIREQMSINTFIAKERLKILRQAFHEQTNQRFVKHPKLNQIITRFKATIKRAIYECEVQNQH